MMEIEIKMKAMWIVVVRTVPSAMKTKIALRMTIALVKIVMEQLENVEVSKYFSFSYESFFHTGSEL